ncbi:MAG: flagellin [Planctomycetota bacterium]
MRINTNITSLQAQRSLGHNNNDLSMRLERLSTGLKINTGKDGPAALIASENMRSEMAGIRQAIDNSTRANNVINTAEGSLAEVNNLLLQVQALTNEAANTGALAPAEIEANQLQVDAILGSINRISNTTTFNGENLLNGALDYTLSGVTVSNVPDVKINSADLPDNGSIAIDVDVTTSAQTGRITVGANASGVVTLEIAGNKGVEQLTFASGTTTIAMATAINSIKESTGVEANLSGTTLHIDSVGYGSSQFVSVEAISGPWSAASGTRDTGVDAELSINGSAAVADGLNVKSRVGGLDLELELSVDFGTQTAVNESFNVTGGGATFQVGSTVGSQGQVNVGVASVNTNRLGNNQVGFLSQIGSGGDASLVAGETTKAQEILTAAIQEIATLRGRLGALQKNVLETNITSLGVALENVTAAESDIRDADFASETAQLSRAQILTQANTAILAQANATPQQVLSLLQ